MWVQILLDPTKLQQTSYKRDKKKTKTIVLDE